MPSKADNIKKVAVTIDEEGLESRQAQFLELDQARPLAAVIKDICDGWGLPNPEDYALQFNETSRQAYITERNRNEIQIGNVLKLTCSPAKKADEILDKLNPGLVEVKVQALRQLSTLSQDSTFAQEFINKTGLHLLINMVEAGSYTGDALAYTLKAFVELMDHSIVSWDILEQKFIKMVSNSLNTRSSGGDAVALQSALEILESIVLHSTGKYSLVEQEVTPVDLVNHLKSTNIDIQKNALALINAMFVKADDYKMKKIATDLQCKSIRNVILNCIIQRSNAIGTEMAHELYVLQTLLFRPMEEKRTARVDPTNPTLLRDINELRKIAFDIDSDPVVPGSKKQGHVKDYTKLGFQNPMNPAEDFLQVPPGALALDNMFYFAKLHGVNYTKVVLENSCRADEHDCPFAKACIELTLMLSDILKVGELPLDDGRTFHAIFFTHDRAFEEFFVICIELLNKTWKEMRATAEDLAKVLDVVREQINRALDSQPRTFDQLKLKLQQLTYGEITKIWQQERRHKEEWESQAKPVQQLREQLKPEIMDLIKRQRLNYLVDGSLLNSGTGRNTRKGKFCFCCLSPNHKYLHYGDHEENKAPLPIEQLPNKLAVVDIKSLVTGKDCPHIKDKEKQKKSSQAGLAFSIMTEAEAGDLESGTPTSLNLVAPSEEAFDMWVDGINALLGNPMNSRMTDLDLETLLSMEIKLRLLDTEGVNIPENPPPIPKEPDNYDFAYDL